MRRWFLGVFLTCTCYGQAPQTARQALLEILKASSPEQVDKHTPEVLLKALQQLPPEERQKQQQSMMFLSMALQMSPQKVQTFETGPVLLAVNDPANNGRFEVTVERDDLAGDTDTMEFGIHVTKDGKDQAMPFAPRVLIDMKMEKNAWKLSRIGGSASLQLDDPQVVEQIMTRLRAKGPTPTIGIAVPGDQTAISAIASLRKLNTAELAYSATYPRVGFTCRLSDLGGSLGGKAPDEHGAQLINPGLESGVRNGYRIDLSGCEGAPASRYHIVVIPMQKGAGKRTYCTDQAGTIRSIEESASGDCFSRGTPIR